MRFHLPANVYAHPDPDLDDVNTSWRFPGAVSTGKTVIHEVECDSKLIEWRISEDGLTLELDGHPADAVGTLPHPICIHFSLTFPKRFGPFGTTESGLFALDGWYPLPLSPDGGILNHTLKLVLQVETPGQVVTGRKVRRTVPKSPMSPVLLTNAPWFLAYRFNAEVLEFHGQTTHLMALVQRTDSRWERVMRILANALPAEFPTQSPFLVVEAPLREALALPFPGGVLVSDRILQITPIQALKQRHDAALVTAALAARLMSRGFRRHEALLAVALRHEVKKRVLESRKLRKLFRTGEVLAVIDEVGTDSQSGFEGTLFFQPHLSGTLRRCLPWVRTPYQAPSAIARQLFLKIGPDRSQQLVAAWMAENGSFRQGLVRHLTASELHFLDETAKAPPGDLSLERWECDGEEGCTLRVCTSGFKPGLLVEFQVDEHRLVMPCKGPCCLFSGLSGTNGSQVLLDPDERLWQQTKVGQDPRRNDRNSLDLKWMLARPFFTITSGDTVPTAGFELLVQPRYDLRNQFFIGPYINPNRFIGFLGWRRGFGPKLRPNSLSTYMTLSLRGAVGLDDNDETSFGPAVSIVHSTVGLRMNPHQGYRGYGYTYPLFSANFDKFGIRYGAMASYLTGPSYRHVFAFQGRIDAINGWKPQWERIFMGGDGGVRGLATGGREVSHSIGFNAEYRWMAALLGHHSLAQLEYLTGLQLALFVDGALGAEGWAALPRADSLLLSAGAGIRVHVDTLGFIPSMIRVDGGFLLPVGWSKSLGFAATVGFVQPF